MSINGKKMMAKERLALYLTLSSEEVSWMDIQRGERPVRLWNLFEGLVMQNQTLPTDCSHSNNELPTSSLLTNDSSPLPRSGTCVCVCMMETVGPYALGAGRMFVCVGRGVRKRERDRSR